EPRPELTRAAFADECVAAGEIGEIVVSGDHVVTGYLGGFGDWETKFRVEGVVWHRTGDAGRFDGQGRLWFAGRCAARVKLGHRILYPTEVEVPLRKLSGLGRAALLEIDGEACLVLETASAVVAESAAARLRALNLPVPRMQRLRRLPLDRRHNAKIDYATLRRVLKK
ncbi:MAG: AMP-dependent synthetase, partial [Verrucomicrobia bacterium]